MKASSIPNVELQFKGMIASVVALKDLSPGQDISLDSVTLKSEGEVAADSGLLQSKIEYIQNMYGFDCSTTGCSCSIPR
jgi:hypothetical protein